MLVIGKEGTFFSLSGKGGSVASWLDDITGVYHAFQHLVSEAYQAAPTYGTEQH